MSITSNIIEDEVVTKAENDVRLIRYNSGDEFRQMFETGEGDIAPESIDKFFKEADQPFIEQFAHELNTGVQDHFAKGDDDLQNRGYWQRAQPILERFKDHQAKAGRKDFAVLEAKKNQEINAAWGTRKKDYHLPLFTGEKQLEEVDEKHRDRVINTQFIAEANELDPEQVNENYELYRAQLWDGYKLEGEPTDAGLKERIREDLVKADERQTFIQEIAKEAQRNAFLGESMNWTRSQDTGFAWDFDRQGVKESEAKRIYRNVARNATKEFKTAGPLGMQLIDALAKDQGIKVDVKDQRERSSDSVDILVSKIVMLPREEREKILYVASLNAEKLGLSNDGFSDGLITSLDRGGVDFMQDVTSKVTRMAHADVGDVDSVEKLEAMKREHDSKFGKEYHTSELSREEMKPFYESEDKIKSAETSLRVQNWREFNQDIRSVRDIVKKVESQNQESLLGKIEQGSYDAAYSVPRMAAMILPYAGMAMNWASYSEANDAQLRRQYPEMDAKNRERISNISAIPQAFIEKLQFRTLFSKAPMMTSVMQKLGAKGAVASLLGRGTAGIAKEYAQERLQDAMLPLTHEIASALSEDIPEVKAEVWDEALKIYDERTFFAVLPLAILGAGGSTAMDKMGAESFRKYLANEDQLMLSGLTKDEAGIIQGMNEAGSVNSHKEYQKMMQGKNADEIKANSEEALKDGALDRVMESEVMENGTDAEKKAFGEAKQAFDELVEVKKRVNGDIRNTDEGKVEVVFPESHKKVNEYYDNEQEAHEAYTSAIEEYDMQQSAAIQAKQAKIEELQGIETVDDANKAVSEHLADAHEGSETKFIDKDFTLESAIKQGQITIEGAQERLDIAMQELGVNMNLRGAKILGSNTLKANAKGYVNRIYKGANIATVFEESAEGYMKMAIENGLSYDYFAQNIAEYQKATGEILVKDVNNISEQETIEGFSKLARAHVYNERESSSFPPQIRAILDAFKQFFDSVLDTANNLLQLKKDGKLAGDFEMHLNKAVGLDEDAILHNQQKRYEREIMEEMLDPETELSTVMKGQLPRPADLAENETLKGEVQRIWDAMTNFDSKGRRSAGKANAWFAEKGSDRTLHKAREYANEAGFDYETESELLEAVEASIAGDKKYPSVKASFSVENKDRETRGFETSFSIDYRDQHSAPYGNPNGKTGKQRLEDGEDLSLLDYSEGNSIVPDDYFSPVGARYYGYEDSAGQESYQAIIEAFQQIQDGESPMVTIYRAIPKDITTEINNGDWITMSREYAEIHGESRFDGEYEILEEEVRPREIWWDGNDINEWGFDDGTGVSFESKQEDSASYVDFFNKSGLPPAAMSFIENIVKDNEGNIDASIYDYKKRIGDDMGKGWTRDGVDFLESKKGLPKTSFSITPQQDPLVAKIQKLIRDPETKATVFKVMAMRLSKLKSQQGAKLTKRLFDGEGEVSTHEELLDSIAQLDAIIAVLPKEIRGQIGGYKRLAELKTVRGRTNYLVRRLERVDDALEKFTREQFVEQVEKLIKKAQPTKNKTDKVAKGKITPEGHDELKAIESVLAMDEDALDKSVTDAQVLEAKSMSEENQEKADAMALEANTALARLSTFGNLYNKKDPISARGAQNAYNEIKHLIDNGRMRYQQKLLVQKEHRDSLKLKALKVITGGKGSKNREQRLKDGEGGQIKRWVKQEHSRNISFEMMLNGLSRKDTSSETMNSWINQYFGEATHKATHGENQASTQKKAEMLKMIAGVYGINTDKASWRRKVEDAMVEMNERTNKSGIFIEEGAKSKKLKSYRDEVEAILRGEITHIHDGYSWIELSKSEIAEFKSLLDADNAKTKGAKKKNFEITRKVDGKMNEQYMNQDSAMFLSMMYKQEGLQPAMQKHGYTDEVMDQFESFLTPKSKLIRQWLFAKYDQNYDYFNATFADMFGVNLPQVKNYSPARSIHAGRQAQDMIDAGHGKQSTTPGMAMERIKHMAEPRYDVGALSVFMQHVDSTEHFVHWAKPVAELRSVFMDKKVREAILDYHGEELYKEIIDRIDVFAEGGNSKATVNKYFDHLRKTFTVAKLAFNWSVFLKQWTSIPAYGFDIPASKFLKYEAEFFASPVKNWQKMWSLDYTKQRFEEGYDRDVMAVLNSLEKKKSKLAKLAEFGMISGRAGDIMPVIVGGYAAYRHGKQKALDAGMTEAQAEARGVLEFEMSTDRAQQSGNLKDQSSYGLGGSLFRIFTMFQTSPRQYYANMSEAVLDAYAGREGGKKRAAKAIFISHVILPSAFYWVSAYTRNVVKDEEDREDMEEMLKGWGASMALGPLSGIFLWGQIGNELASGYDYRLPIIQFGSEAKNGIHKALKLLSDDEINEITTKDIMGVMDSLATSASLGIGGAATWYDIGTRFAKSVGVDGDDVERLMMSEVDGQAHDFKEWKSDFYEESKLESVEGENTKKRKNQEKELKERRHGELLQKAQELKSKYPHIWEEIKENLGLPGKVLNQLD